MHKLIAVEGLSATGKSTVGQLVAEKLGGVFYKTPSEIFAASRPTVDERADITSRFFFYLAGILQSSLEVKELLQNQIVVCDRFWATTHCYHRAMGVPVQDLVTTHVIERIASPDHQFLITCPDEIRLVRLEKRGLSFNDRVERQSGVEERFLAEYRRWGLIEIDNSTDDPNVAVEQILSII